MSQKVINTSMPNDGLGDALRDAFNDTNDNFTELYSSKVDKVGGKDLSDNNLTDALVDKINNIDDSAEENIQSDWAQNDNLEKDFIKNKPTLVNALAPSKVSVSFDFPVNNKTGLDSLHGTFLINNSEDGIILNSVTPIVGDGGLSKVMAVVKAGTVLTGDLIIAGTSIDRNTGVETPADTETISIDGLSTDNSTTDSNANPVHSYIGNYISSKFWKGTLTFSTPDLDLTEIRFAQVAYEQFDDIEDLTVDSLDATYKISNTAAVMDAYLYAVEVVDFKATVTMIAEIHHASGEEVDAVYRRKLGLLNRQIDGTTDGIFIDLFLAPPTQEYFNSFTIKVWASALIPMSLFIDNSAMNESIVYGETLTAGEIAYLATDGKYYTADNTDTDTSTTQLRLITISGILDDEKIALKEGKYTTSGLTAGNEYLGVNGGVVDTPPTDPAHVVRIISTAISTNSRYFNPSATWLLGDGSTINGVIISPESIETLSDAWSVGGLDVRAYATNAPILDQFYTGDPQTVTVGAAPTTVNFLRFDAIVMNTSGVISVQAGVEGLAAFKPAVDSDSFYLIRYLLISFGDTSPTDEDGNGSSEFDVLYKEFGTEAGGESDVTTTDATITINAAGSPFGGVGIRGLNVPSNGTRKIDFTHTTKRLFSDLTGLYFNFSLDEVVKRTRLYVELYNESVRVGRAVVVNNNFGFSDRVTTGQNIGIPKEYLNIISTEYDRVRIYVGAPVLDPIAGFWIDEVILNNSFSSNPNIPEPIQLQSDWDQSDDTAVDFIKNKPSVGVGDMTKAVYDPNTVEGDAFAQDNFINATVGKTTPIDADNFTLWDSVSGGFKKLTFANLKVILNTLFVRLTTNQTIAGVKTFSSSPIVPAPTTDLQAATKKYVDDNAGGVTADSVGLNEEKDELKARVNMGTGTVLNWILGVSYIHDILTGNLTITDSNLPTGTDSKTITIDIDLDSFSLTVPAYWTFKGGGISASGKTRIVVDCVNGTGSSEEVYYTLIPNA